MAKATTIQRKVEKPKSIFAILDADGQLIDYFTDLYKVEKYLEDKFIEEATILEVVRAIEASMPPEPELELNDKDLSELV